MDNLGKKLERTIDTETILSDLDSSLLFKLQATDNISSGLISQELFQEIKELHLKIPIFFGKTLCDIKLIIRDEYGAHEVYLKYKGPKNLVVTSTELPFNLEIMDKKYESLLDIFTAIKVYVDTLRHYFHQLNRIDELFTIKEPLKSTYMENYRKIYLDTTNVLNVEVTPQGELKNIYLIGRDNKLSDCLQDGIKTWNTDIDIADNIINIFGQPKVIPDLETDMAREDNNEYSKTCGMCFAGALQGYGEPVCVCKIPSCREQYFHKKCIVQFLLGYQRVEGENKDILLGQCPTCFASIQWDQSDV